MSRRSEVVYINGAPSTPGYLLALLLELLHVPLATAGPYRNCRREAGTKSEPKSYFSPDQKKGSESRSSRFEPKISLISFSRGSGPPLKSKETQFAA